MSLINDDSFGVPQLHVAGGLRLELLGPEHSEGDHRAWTSSIEHIRATPGFDGHWPPVEGMSLSDNSLDLQSHADRSRRRVDFAYAVLDNATGEVIGCVYLKPVDGVTATSWVTASRAELDEPLTRIVGEWLRREWPFEVVHYRLGRTPVDIKRGIQVWDLLVTMEMARQIRAWRVDEGCSYRVLAALADQKWGTTTGGNQLFGEDLCRVSATLHGEDINADPWT